MAIVKRLLDYVTANERVCPKPGPWHRLFKMLPGEPPLPPILAAWHEATPAGKARALEGHLRHAAEHGCLGEVERFLRSLRPDDWFRAGS